ncbi:MAG: O-antigen ligase family protein [Geminicoccaceae bacterium]|nr:O-antigen ligase family protein [Geminicoccaceae bacterium]
MPATLEPRWPQSILFALFVALLAWAPLPLASNRPWSWALLSLVIGLLVVLWASASLALPERLRLPRSVGLALFGAALVILWIWAQVRPDLVGSHPLLTAHPIWEAARRAGLEVEPTIALDPWNARDAAMRLLAYWGAFWLAFALCQHARRARRLLLAIVGIGTTYATVGLVLHFAGIEWLLTEPKTWYLGDLTATFVNRNHFATFANLALLAALGLLVETVLSARGAVDLRRRVAKLSGHLLGRRSPLLVAVLVLATAMLLTHSRGGMLSGLAGLATLLLLVLVAARPGPRIVLLSVTRTLGLTAGLLAYSGAGTLERLDAIGAEADLGAGTRLAAYQLALQALADRPWTGHGYGGFEQVFHLYRDERFRAVFDRLHNTPLEHAVELGLPATMLLYLGPLAILVLCVRGVLTRRRDQVFPLVGAAATVCVGCTPWSTFPCRSPPWP